jgi:hypothetical protein
VLEIELPQRSSFGPRAANVRANVDVPSSGDVSGSSPTNSAASTSSSIASWRTPRDASICPSPGASRASQPTRVIRLIMRI